MRPLWIIKPLDVHKILYSYDPRAGKLSTTFAHPTCAKRAGLVRDGHEIPGDVVELFWKCWAKKVAGI